MPGSAMRQINNFLDDPALGGNYTCQGAPPVYSFSTKSNNSGGKGVMFSTDKKKVQITQGKMKRQQYENLMLQQLMH